MLAVIKERSRGARRCFRLLSVGFVSVGEMLKTVSRGFKKSIEAAAGSVLSNGGQFRTEKKKLMGFVL